MALFTIDRTINFEEEKVKKVLKIIDTSLTDEEIEDKMVEQQIVRLQERTSNHGFFKRRWVTFLKEFGVYDGERITEIGKLYLNDFLSTKELTLLFLVDRTVNKNSTIIRPFEVLLKVSQHLKQNLGDNTIYEDDLKYAISKVTNDENIVIAVNTILKSRRKGRGYNLNVVVEPCHYDIWRNILKTAGINDSNAEIKINLDLEIVRYILKYYKENQALENDSNRFISDFIEKIRLPKKANDNEEILYTKKTYSDQYDETIYKFLFEPKTQLRKLEANIFKKDQHGDIPFRMLNGFNISTSDSSPANNGMYNSFIGYEGIIINKLRKTGDAVYSFIGSHIKSYIDSNFNSEICDIKEEEEVNGEMVDITYERLEEGYNKIVYGIPGCGKSWYVENKIIANDSNHGKTFRTTFYPDYTNSDFVGQIIPQINDSDNTSVLYNIQCGPFLESLKYAILHPNENVYLVIEEINRGNAAAIFGDIFQLLDRHKKENENDKLNNNTSEYSIKNYLITTNLKMEIEGKYSVNYDLENIRIPSNMIIIGTMNTSDQNVFTLDTAFKRRWQMEYIKNDLYGSRYANELLPGTTVTWAKFVDTINSFITSSENGINMNGEDKQIGAYFISGDEWSYMKAESDEDAIKYFAEKILAYIWEDVAKINRESWFDSKKYKTLESVIDGYINKGLNVFGDDFNFTTSDNE